eukprot:m.108366 g.108366  ORF g.108366 m.108366 type:complete len:1405 (-) comp12705_c0_seq1:157-4371(-)
MRRRKEDVVVDCKQSAEEEDGSGSDREELERLEKGRPNPMGSVNIFSKISFGWVTSMISTARKRDLGLGDVDELPKDLGVEASLAAFDGAWKKEVEQKGEDGASLAIVLIKVFKRQILSAFALNMLAFIFAIVTPLAFLRNLIKYGSQMEEDIGLGVGLAIGLFLSDALRSACIQNYWFYCLKYAVRMRAIVFALVYRKSLELRDLGGYSVGELVNVTTNDSQRVFEAGLYSIFIVVAGISGVTVMVITSLLLGPAAIAGLAVFFLMIPIQIYFSKRSGALRRVAIHETDRRVRLMNELLTCIKLIKMYAWEKPFANKIGRIRDKEKRALQTAGYLQSVTISLVPVLPAVASVVTFLIQAYFGDGMSADDVFTVLALYNVLRFSLAVLPMGVKARAEAKIGMQRLRNFILLKDDRNKLKEPQNEDVAIEFTNTTISWPPLNVRTDKTNSNKKINLERKRSKKQQQPQSEQATSASSGDKSSKRQVHQDNVVLHNVNLTLEKGQLVGVCGSVGSGKSSLLSTLLGQTKVNEGSACVRGSIAYVSQQAWIQSDTLKNNILFGNKMDRSRYDEAIRCCSLTRDLEVLPAGEMTEIGERGINVSGGQKQRIALARAVFADHDVYLLDDPLSAVDAHVGKSIFEHCIQRQLEEKTVLLVTHQLQYLPHCDRVCFVDGETVHIGTHKGLLEENKAYQQLIAKHHQDDMEDDDVDVDDTDMDNEGTNAKMNVVEESDVNNSGVIISNKKKSSEGQPGSEKSDGTLISKEAMAKGSVSFSTYMSYAKSGGGVLLFLFMLLLFAIAMFGKAYSDFYLAIWIKAGDGNETAGIYDRGDPSDNPDINNYALVFGLIVLGILVVQFIKGGMFTFLCLRASTRLHQQLFSKVTKAPMYFFDTTPTGRILNRFSKDLDEIDVRLLFQLEQFLQNLLLIVATIALIAYIFPYFLIAFVPIAVVFLFLVAYSRPAQRQTKRLDHITRSPLISQISATLQGMHTIAAFGKQNTFQREFFRRLDKNSKCFFSFYLSSRWFAFRLDYTTAAITFCVAIISVALHGRVSPSLLGAAITFALSLGGITQYTTRLSAEVESRFTSAERIISYIKSTPVEEDFDKKPPPNLPHNWPNNGEIEFKDVEVCYRPGLPAVLKGVNLHIHKNEKIGIVGRTGAGKSTIAMVLFRMMDLSKGKIIIDGVDTSSMGTNFLRSKLSIIPQDPVLFVGTIRYNVDPFGEYEDAEIWHALEQAHVKPFVSSLEQGLESEVVENGENFSVGERQLLCMARALLRNSKVLVMDEATAAIDTKTDSLIQETIREAFKDCTVLTIAHRLNTIMDSDRILVMDNGEVAEFDHPQILLHRDDSIFADMLESTGVAANREKGFDEEDFRKQLQQQQQQRYEEDAMDRYSETDELEPFVSISVI